MYKKLMTATLVAMTSLFSVARSIGDRPNQETGREGLSATNATRRIYRHIPRVRTPKPPRVHRMRHNGGAVHLAPQVIYVNGTPQTYYAANTTTQVIPQATPQAQPVYVCNQTTQATGTGATVDEAQLQVAVIQPVETKVFSDTNGWTKISGQVLIDSQGKVILPKEYQQFHVGNVKEYE